MKKILMSAILACSYAQSIKFEKAPVISERKSMHDMNSVYSFNQTIEKTLYSVVNISVERTKYGQKTMILWVQALFSQKMDLLLPIIMLLKITKKLKLNFTMIKPNM